MLPRRGDRAAGHHPHSPYSCLPAPRKHTSFPSLHISLAKSRAPRRGGKLDAIIIGHELTLPSAGAGGNAGSLDLLLLEPSGELWAIEAKLSRNAQSNPEYVFGNQLKRYAISMMETHFREHHRHIESFAFGHRVHLKPPEVLATRWQNARSLEAMLRGWLELRGDASAADRARYLVRVVERRMALGKFTCAVLTDEARPDQCRWIDEKADGFPLALLELNEAGNLRVVRRPELAPVDLDDEDIPLDLPPFLRIPGTYHPLPSTIPRILNEWAYDLYHDVVQPRTIALVGESQFAKPAECDHASFRYRVPIKCGAPLVLEIGRGAERHMGERWLPGSTALRINVNLLWAVSEAWKTQEVAMRALIRDELWSLCAALIDKAGYHIKGSCRGGGHSRCERSSSRESIVVSSPIRGSSNELILERNRRDLDFDGELPEHLEEDRRALHAMFDAIDDAVVNERPLPLLKRTAQVKRGGGSS